jgi:hypothetical protein
VQTVHLVMKSTTGRVSSKANPNKPPAPSPPSPTTGQHHSVRPLPLLQSPDPPPLLPYFLDGQSRWPRPTAFCRMSASNQALLKDASLQRRNRCAPRPAAARGEPRASPPRTGPASAHASFLVLI